MNIDGNALKTDGCACACGRNGKGGKLLSRVYIYFVCVSTCDDNNPFSVSSVFRFFRYIYNRRTDGKGTGVK